MGRRIDRRSYRLLAVGILVPGCLALAGCSVRKLVVGRVADALAGSGSGWGSDDDPRLVGDALPFALKTMESLLAETPDHRGLLLGLCRGFTSYAAGWVEPAAEALEGHDFAGAKAGKDRSLRLFLRAKRYCTRALELGYPAATRGWLVDPRGALAAVDRGGVDLLYWTGASWGSAIALGVDHPELTADLPVVRALFERARTLAPDFDHGAIDEAMIPLESLPDAAGGSAARARAAFDRAVELSEGRRASPYVTWARTSCVAHQDRADFRQALARALAIDPDAVAADRLANRLAQERARALMARIDELFYAEETPGDAPGGSAGETTPGARESNVNGDRR